MGVRLNSDEYIELKNRVSREKKILAELDEKAEEFKKEKGFESRVIKSSEIKCLEGLIELLNQQIKLLNQYGMEIEEESSKLEEKPIVDGKH